MVEPWKCPRCERTTTDSPAMSRYAWGNVCSRCGVEEGLQVGVDAGAISPAVAAETMIEWERIHEAHR